MTRKELPDHLTLEDVREIAAESDSMYEFMQKSRTRPRGKARWCLQQVGEYERLKTPSSMCFPDS